MERDHFDQSDRLNERKVTLKRRYTENHPAITAGKAARIRNKMLEAIADGKITQDEFNMMLSELSADSKRWMKRNSKYFNVSEDGVTLSKSGSRILNQIKTEKPTMRKLVMESFNEFVNNDSSEMINEGTRGQFGKIYKNGEIRSVYTHYDSYPEHMLPIIKKAYKKGNVDDIISKGDNSGLEASVDKMNFYGVPDAMNPMKGKKSNIDSYIKQAANDGGAEFIYLYDESDKKWYMVDVYGDRALVPAFESVETEGEELNEAYVKSVGYKAAQERIEDLARQLDPNSRLCKGISKAADNVAPEFREMKKHMDEIYSIWQDVEYTIAMSNESTVTEENEKLFEAEVEMDAMDPDNKDFLKFLKKNRVKIIDKTMAGPAGNHPVILMQGKRKDLENVLADCDYGWCDEELAEYIEESIVTEAVNASAFVKAGKLGYNDQFLGRKSLSKTLSMDLGLNPKHEFGGGDWLGFDHIALYARGGKKTGTILADALSGKYTYDELKAAAADFLGVKESVETNEELNEAFKSSKLRNLMNMDHGHTSYGKKIHGLAQAFYDLTKAKLDQIGDEQLIDFSDPKQAAKEFRRNKDAVIFFISDNHKENPYAPKTSYNNAIRPGIIGVSKGNDFLGAHYTQSGKTLGKNKRKANYIMSPSDESAIGGNKKYGGYEASGLATIKRVVDVADRAIVINLAAIKDTELDARQKVADRIKAQEGAIAFQSADEFKKANVKRYKEILATKASKLPLDKMVEDAINELSKHIADGIKSGEKTAYGEIKLGQDKRGRDIKATDAANIMSSILSDYERYVRYVADAEKEKDSGYSTGYYEKEAKEYAKRVSDRVKKVKDMDYAW
jgi:hypothetical protein